MTVNKVKKYTTQETLHRLLKAQEELHELQDLIQHVAGKWLHVNEVVLAVPTPIVFDKDSDTVLVKQCLGSDCGGEYWEEHWMPTRYLLADNTELDTDHHTHQALVAWYGGE